ncbi:similar to 1110014F24Rik protein (predicted), isoform CRA_a [Rattus norvegicus]|uniref:Dermokine n=2 Tax=Rattus norvegicus TaxID=10116 RepID=A0ABK0LAG7_RAT|nr:dermokine isoform X4 [Rattus norvegicus]EDM07711.1 similar to 1110014F24Rik protein (predicted), isoform CRA_a [Rattus norvegicus]|eukprot:XP_003748885.1 PREDICTED: dermokine-like [Rattus norvegicus]
MKPVAVSALLLVLLGVVWRGDSHSWGSDLSSLQKRAGGADQFSQPEAARQDLSAESAKNYYNNAQVNPTYNWQYYTKTTPKAGVTPSSSASRAQPGLLKWLKFW